jgi:hypothetical protein
MRNLEMDFTPAMAPAVHAWSVGIEQELRAATNEVSQAETALVARGPDLSQFERDALERGLALARDKEAKVRRRLNALSFPRGDDLLPAVWGKMISDPMTRANDVLKRTISELFRESSFSPKTPEMKSLQMKSLRQISDLFHEALCVCSRMTDEALPDTDTSVSFLPPSVQRVLDEIRLPITGNADIDNQLQAASFFGHTAGEQEVKNGRGAGNPFGCNEAPLLEQAFSISWSIGRKWAIHGDIGVDLYALSQRLEELGYPQEGEETEANTVLRVVK